LRSGACGAPRPAQTAQPEARRRHRAGGRGWRGRGRVMADAPSGAAPLRTVSGWGYHAQPSGGSHAAPMSPPTPDGRGHSIKRASQSGDDRVGQPGTAIMVPRRKGAGLYRRCRCLSRRDWARADGTANGGRPHQGRLTRQGVAPAKLRLSVPTRSASPMTLRSRPAPGGNASRQALHAMSVPSVPARSRRGWSPRWLQRPD